MTKREDLSSPVTLMRYRITKKQAKAIAREEAETSIKYKKMGFKREAKDEARHARVFGEVAKSL